VVWNNRAMLHCKMFSATNVPDFLPAH